MSGLTDRVVKAVVHQRFLAMLRPKAPGYVTPSELAAEVERHPEMSLFFANQHAEIIRILRAYIRAQVASVMKRQRDTWGMREWAHHPVPQHTEHRWMPTVRSGWRYLLTKVNPPKVRLIADLSADIKLTNALAVAAEQAGLGPDEDLLPHYEDLIRSAKELVTRPGLDARVKALRARLLGVEEPPA